MKKEKIYNLITSNRIIYEDLSKVEDSVFEEVYKQADWTLYKIIQDGKQYFGKDGKDDCSLNVLSFLGKRGRGKTSTMLSFLSSLDKLKGSCDWSNLCNLCNLDKIKFIKLPYIDAAMLAENEYIFDVILAEMWDAFEERIEAKPGSRVGEDSEYLVQKIKRAFIDVRKAYLVLKEREKNAFDAKNKDMTTSGELHELAASLNLCTEMKKLVNCYLDFFYYGQEYTYLVITIDDVDMSGDKAYLILEQIRRFLRIPRVIILLTADIDRLQRSCEARYSGIYPDEYDRQHFINEYLEKVLPYNMRMYMPEVKEQYDDIQINLPKRETDILKLQNNNEKDMILEFIVRNCEIYFDGSRRKRHFLQNESMRSMVNYFEKLVRIKGMKEMGYLAWLKIDLKERLIERIQDTGQKKFMRELLAKDYEDINGIVINYINNKFFGEEVLRGDSLGQVLYGCNLLEKRMPENVNFVNCILMFYSVIIKQIKPDENQDKNKDLWQKILGNSLLGEWEYMAVSRNPQKSDICQGFNKNGELSIDITNFQTNESVRDSLNRLIEKNKEAIMAWIYSLMFITVILPIDGNISFDSDVKQIKDHDKEKNNEAIEFTFLDLEPKVNARKSYFSCLYQQPNQIYYNIFNCLKACIEKIKEWLLKEISLNEEEENLESIAQEQAKRILDDMDFYKTESTAIEESVVISAHNVEIFYSIGQALDKIMISTSNNANELFKLISLKYIEIQKTLQKIDKYNEKLYMPTEFEKKFMNTYQARLLLGKIKLPDSLKEKFENKFGNLLSEAYGVNLTKVSEPEK